MNDQSRSADERDLTEIFRKIRRIEIFTKRMVNDLFSGEYHSVFKGQGMEFDEVREYQPGDDVRSIDWNVTARMGTPFIKRFVEERELVVLFVLDVSASGQFGTEVKTKIDTAAEICALLAFSAVQNNDKVGAIIFSDEVEQYIPPDKGRRHVLHVIRNLLFYKPTGRGTNITSALDYLMRVVKRRAIVFILSDFLSADFSKTLAAAANRFDVVAIRIADRRERDLGRARLVRLWDQERGVEQLIDLGNKKSRKRLNDLSTKRNQELRQLFNRYGVDSIDIATGDDYAKPLSMFFRARARRR
ncbi:MAG: DUF58 domain-containing protein [Candidatus Krumholzibacteria bacterium]|nr:DUF58 domain-containing protein [Candidatus Krumholzibacteria bacterium]